MAALPLPAQQSPLDSLYTVFAQAKGDASKLEATVNIMEALYDEGKFPEIGTWADSTAKLAARLPGNPLKVKWDVFKSSSMLQTNTDYEASYSLAMKCAEHFREIKDTSFLSIALFSAGTSISDFNPKAAVTLLQEAAQLAKSKGEDYRAATCLTNVAYALMVDGKGYTDAWLKIIEETLVVFREKKELFGVLVVSNNLVTYYCKKKNFGRARQYMEEMRRFLADSKTEDEELLIYPVDAEAQILDAEGRLEEALPKYEETFEVIKRNGIMDGLYEQYPLLVSIYQRTGRYKQAFETLAGFQALRDTMFSMEKNQTIQNLQTRYETEKKEAQIAVQQADLARSQKEKWGLAAGLAMLSGLAFLFWRQRRKTQAANLELAASNDQIQQKNQKLDLLMRELHHRVKNNLQLVSSLLRLQSRQVGDETASAAIKAGQLRVEAMSLIHQRLYREEGITLVNMQEFTQDLVEKIAFAFGHRLEEMDVKIQFQPTDLDVDKAMPMSLILNELLTNSFKYAFGETARPGLKISLVQQGEKLIFHYADNGPGLPENAGGTGSFGSKLMASLSGQLGGQARQWNEGGARFELVF